jgi:hypothetical protein
MKVTRNGGEKYIAIYKRIKSNTEDEAVKFFD